MAACYACGAELSPNERIYRNSVCPSCGKELHVCLNCEFYSPGAHWDCRESISEPVRDKDRANFCDFFTIATSKRGGDLGATRTRAEKKASDARSSFENLFGNE